VSAGGFDVERSDALRLVPHGFFGAGAQAHQFGYGGPGRVEALAALRASAADYVCAGARVVIPHQTHSTIVLPVAEPWDDTATGRPEGDALVTDQPGIAIGVVTADCAPVLFADAHAGVVGAAHAGWRGAMGGILSNTIAAMEALGADRSRIMAAIGPTIAQASYEVDAPFREHFTPGDDAHFAPAPEREGKARWHFDLPGYIAAQLERAALRSVHDLARDTFAESARYHSYRRASQAGLPNYGRQISLIACP